MFEVRYRPYGAKILSTLVSRPYLLLVTATMVETDVLHRVLQPLPGIDGIAVISKGIATYYIAQLGLYPIVHVQCAMGSIDPNGSLNTISEAITKLKLRAVVMVGIAFGIDSLKQSIGDVLVSKNVIAYEPKRVGPIIVDRGMHGPAESILLNRFSNSRDWTHALHGGQHARVIVGDILSGESLVDNIDYRNELLERFPTARGGEMEGAGLFSVAHAKKIPWIVVKGICDWADGRKGERKEENQLAAAASAVSLCRHIFSRKEAFKDFNCKEVSDVEAKSFSIPKAVSYYLDELINYRPGAAEGWTGEPIKIFGRHLKKGSLRVIEELSKWADGDGPPIMFLLGDVGSGKSTLLSRLGMELANQWRLGLKKECFPIKLLLNRVKTLDSESEEWFLTLTDPRVLNEVFQYARSHGNVVVLVDGLDELIKPYGTDQSQFANVIQAITRNIPSKSRLLVACRSVVYEMLCKQICQTFQTRSSSSVDRIIESELNITPSEYSTLVLEELTIEQVDEYMANTTARKIWKHVRLQRAYQELSRRPITVRLLEVALPHMLKATGSIDLAELYRVAIRIWLQKGTRSADEIDTRMDQIEQLVVTAFMGKTGPVDRGQFLKAPSLNPANHSNVSEKDRLALIESGIFRFTTNNVLVFAHYSFMEFFLARKVSAELIEYAASTLARLNLISAYNINRLLIPMIFRTLAGNATGRKMNASAAAKIKVINEVAYSRFIELTNWRVGVGHGIHPTLVSSDGVAGISSQKRNKLTVSVTPVAKSAAEDNPKTHISWYDAIQYCRWSGARLPRKSDLGLIATQLNDSFPEIFWGEEWSDEGRSYMVCFERRNSLLQVGTVGVNPDFRNNHIGLCVFVNEPH